MMSRVRNIIKIISKVTLITFDDFISVLNVVWCVGAYSGAYPFTFR